MVNVVDYTYMLYFQWNFKSGTMTLFTTDNPNDPTTKTFDLTKRVVAFGTALTRDTIPPSDPSYSAYKERMGVPADSQFSLAKIYVKSQETPGYYLQGSFFNGIDWSKESPMASGGNTQVGVMLQTEDPAMNPTAPTFPPTSIDYATYPWKDPTTPQPPNNESESNALCYLIMTNNAIPPVPPSLPYSGTWLDADAPETGRDAILCMNNAQFWEGWLLPLIQVINRASQIQPTTPVLEPYTDGGATVGLRYTPGTCTAHPNSDDSYYNFTRGSDKISWTWAATNSLLATKNVMQSSGNQWTLNQNVTANTSLTFIAGGQGVIFTLKGNNTVGMRCSSEGDWSSNSSMSFTMQFTLVYVAQRVDDGGVQILQSGTPEVTKGPVKTYHSSGVKWTPSLGEYGATLQTYPASVFQAQLGQYQAALLEGLAGQHKLFLPGGGSYLCNQVMFNAAGDLLTNLAFNGAAPQGQNAEIPSFLLDAPPRQYAQPFVPTPLQEVRSLSMKPVRVGGRKGHERLKYSLSVVDVFSA
ncbi:hypothetical protein CEP54_012868 [Fusarium duplospermum]|uniref:Uncharacterized protein n=1 Tax=Fusarium duplospermum TaxID=1325734 RepID=A0A428P644_9HYPO|nr:hypothetical protein CEP54_012868 [Fusarium duplospermum]